MQINKTERAELKEEMVSSLKTAFPDPSPVNSSTSLSPAPTKTRYHKHWTLINALLLKTNENSQELPDIWRKVIIKKKRERDQDKCEEK